jgi:hypothetical protein
VIGPVTKGELAGPLNSRDEIAAGQAEEAKEHSGALDAASLNYRLGPGGALEAESNRNLLEKPRGAALDSADLLGRDVLRWSAKAARLKFSASD